MACTKDNSEKSLSWIDDTKDWNSRRPNWQLTRPFEVSALSRAPRHAI